jgi:integrase
MTAKKAPNTRKAYHYALENFNTWCKQAGRDPMPATADTVALYLAHQLKSGARMQTAKIRLSAIRDAHMRAKKPIPIDDAVRELIQNARRRLRERPAGKAAVTVEHLERISGKLTEDGSHFATRDRALIVFGFALGWRRSELSSLDLADVEVDRRGATVHLRSSKTDQRGTGRVVGIPRASRTDLCPVRALQAWLRIRGTAPGPLFTIVDNAGKLTNDRIKPDTINQRVKRAMERIGEDSTRYGAHSLRAGFITAAAEAGATELAIMQRSGHTCIATVVGYVRPAAAFRGDPLAGTAIGSATR